MNKRIIAGALGAFALVAGAMMLQAKEPTVMTVNGRAVPLSEFEYLYRKNQAQTQLQPLDEYVDIFKLYKLKVADALSMGLDTTKAFRDEYSQYRNELAMPYMTDSAYIQQLVDEAYGYYRQQVHPFHIMLAKTPDAVKNRELVNRLDSIRRLLLEHKADFSSMARQYSQDRSSASHDGDLGWTNNPNFPYSFLKAINTLRPGEISEVIESPMAFHLIKVDGVRPHEGYLSAAHIMKRFRPGATEAEKDSLKAAIDSIYAVVKATPEKFEEMAVRFSEDPGSSKRGGKMEPFPRGAYPEPFDSIAFALKDNEISAPLATPYGWHIIKRFGTRPLETAAAVQNQLHALVTNPRDIRAEMVSERQLENLGKKFNLKPVKKTLDVINAYISSHGIDSLFQANMGRTIGNAPIYTFKGGSLTLADMQPQLNKYVNLDPQFAAEEFTRRTNKALSRKLMPLKEAVLERTNPDFRNLLHEFRDGSLLYEAGRIRVWDRAATDTAGLTQYFADHRNDYKWQQPRAKGYLIQCASDSVEQLVKERIKHLQPGEYIPVLRKEFGDKIQIDRVLAQKGVNSMVDFLAFDGQKAAPANTRFTTYFMADMKLLNAPEDMTDVRGLVITDYQNYLMQQWEDSLRGKYPVTVNTKVLKKVKTN